MSDFDFQVLWRLSGKFVDSYLHDLFTEVTYTFTLFTKAYKIINN